MTRKQDANLHPVVQRVVSAWPLIVMAGTLLLTGASVDDRVRENTEHLGKSDARLDKIEHDMAEIRSDFAAIRQSEDLRGQQLDRVEDRVNDIGDHIPHRRQ